jgi:hypothetical protein
VITTRTSLILARTRVISKRKVQFPPAGTNVISTRTRVMHAKCNSHTHECNLDTYACEYDNHEGDYDTIASDFTRRVWFPHSLERVVLTRMRVNMTHECDNDTFECDFYM